MLLKAVRSATQQCCDRLARASAGKRVVDGVFPELYTHGAKCGIRYGLRDAGELDVEGSESDVDILCLSRDKASDQVRIVVVLSVELVRLEHINE